MLCFNYIANVIKLMRKSLGDERWDMLGRRTCRDMREYAGICGNMRGYAGICGDMRGYAGICGDMRDGPPLRNRPGRAAVFGPVPPNPLRAANGSGK